MQFKIVMLSAMLLLSVVLFTFMLKFHISTFNNSNILNGTDNIRSNNFTLNDKMYNNNSEDNNNLIDNNSISRKQENSKSKTLLVANKNRLVATFSCASKPQVYYSKISMHSSWWRRLSSWEPFTQDTFCRVLTKEMIYIGFGEWIGPTVLLAATFVKHAYGLEPDPLAFKAMKLNVLSNEKSILDKITIEERCIADKNGNVTMVGAATSSSTLVRDDLKKGVDVQSRLAKNTFVVQCNTLKTYIIEKKLLNEKLFIKIDTEGAEMFIIPTFESLLDEMTFKPTLYISFHSMYSNIKGNPQIQKQIVNVLSKYKWAYLANFHQTKLKRTRIAAKDLKENDINGNNDVLVTDNDNDYSQ